MQHTNIPKTEMMKKTTDKPELITIRVSKQNEGLKAKLEKLANKEDRKLNNYLEKHLMKLAAKKAR